MISRLEIKKLFNRFDYNIDLQRNTITILTGPNGYGKSTILKIISALSSANMIPFYRISFQKITVTFDDNTTVAIEQENIDGDIHSVSIDNQKVPLDLFTSTAKLSPWIHNISKDVWVDMRSQERLNSKDILRYLENNNVSEYSSNKLEFLPQKIHGSSAVIEKLKSIAEKCGDVRLISEERLIRKEVDGRLNEQVVDVISKLPQKMKSIIGQLTADYSKAANSLDSTYPQRLLSTKEGLSGESEFKEKMGNANAKFEKLSNYDLVDFSIIDPVNYEEEFSKALKIYFEDFEKKYSVFADFITRLDLYTDIVNSRLNFKAIKVTRDNGLMVVDKDDPTHVLKLEQLSSGEKQEIVLFYELIFESGNQLVLLIDEPEISLHIMWQKLFMDDLNRVVDLGNLKVVVATHSPQIINNRWDLQIDLGELYNE